MKPLYDSFLIKYIAEKNKVHFKQLQLCPPTTFEKTNGADCKGDDDEDEEEPLRCAVCNGPATAK